MKKKFLLGSTIVFLTKAILRARGVGVVLGLLLATLTAPQAFGQFATWNETRRGNEEFQAVAFGANLFVAVGKDAMVVTSPDGRNWTRRSVTITGAKPHLNGVAYGVTHGVGKFVAVGEFTGRILRSTDGVQWAVSTAPQANLMKAVAFGGGRFVAVGDSGQIYSSNDATNWTGVYDAGGNLEGIAYGNRRFVAVYGAGNTLTSSDGGVTWSPGTFTSGLNTDTRAVAFGGGRFVLADSNGHSLVTTNCTKNDGSGNFGGKAYAATYAQDYFVVAGASNNRSYIAYSANGTNNWIPCPLSDLSFILKGIAVGNGTLVAVGEDSAGTSLKAGLILTYDLPKSPEVIRVPENQVVANGMNATFSAETWRTIEESYQWFLNGQPIPGATTRSLLVTNVQPISTGRYALRVMNSLGTVTTTTGGLLTSYEMSRHAGLTISNTVGSSIRVEYRDSLQSGNGWQVLTDLVLPQSPHLFIESEAATVHPQRYFRTAASNGSPTRLGIARYNGFSLWGLPGSACVIEYRDTPLGAWNSLTNLTLIGFPHVWFDKDSGNRPTREYRFTANP